MEPRTVMRNGRAYGNAAAVVEITGTTRKTYQEYVLNGKPYGNPAPKHAYIDNNTGDRMYDLGEIHAWMDRRIGKGNTGAVRVATCRKCLQQGVPVTWAGTFYKHRRSGASRRDPWCAGSGDRAPMEVGT